MFYFSERSTVAANCNTEMEIEMRDRTVEHFPAPPPRVHAHQVRHDLLQTHGHPQQEPLHVLTDLSKSKFEEHCIGCLKYRFLESLEG